MRALNRSRRRSIVIGTATAAAACLLLAACSGKASSDPSGSPTAGGPAYELTALTPAPKGDLDSFTWSLYAEPLSLSYAYAFDYPPNQVLANVCESLLRWNADLSYSPGLATAFANPTPTTWVYTIRQGVKFHDGATLTADDVVASLSYHLQPRRRLLLGERLPQREVDREDGLGPGHGHPDAARRVVEPVHGRQPGHDRVGGDAGEGGRRLRQPEHRRELHRTLRLRLVDAGPEHHAHAFRRLLGLRARREGGFGQVRLPAGPEHPHQRVAVR